MFRARIPRVDRGSHSADLAHSQSAVDHQDLAGYVTGRLGKEEHGRTGAVFGFAHSPQKDLLLVMPASGVVAVNPAGERRPDQPRGESVDRESGGARAPPPGSGSSSPARPSKCRRRKSCPQIETRWSRKRGPAAARPLARGAVPAQESLGDKVGRAQIEVHRLLPAGQVHLKKGPVESASGIANQEIERAFLLESGGPPAPGPPSALIRSPMTAARARPAGSTGRSRLPWYTTSASRPHALGRWRCARPIPLEGPRDQGRNYPRARTAVIFKFEKS